MILTADSSLPHRFVVSAAIDITLGLMECALKSTLFAVTMIMLLDSAKAAIQDLILMLVVVSRQI